MSEENTERLEGGTPFEIRVLRELARLNQGIDRFESHLDRFKSRLDALEGHFTGLDRRLAGVEEKVDARLRETRPIWEAVLLRLDKIEARLDGMDTRLERVEDKFDVVAGQWLDVRTDIGRLKKRLPPPEVALTPDE